MQLEPTYASDHGLICMVFNKNIKADTTVDMKGEQHLEITTPENLSYSQGLPSKSPYYYSAVLPTGEEVDPVVTESNYINGLVVLRYHGTEIASADLGTRVMVTLEL